MNRLSTTKRVQVVASLVEGNSVRATCRMTGVAKGTILRLLVDLGEACREYHDRHVRKVNAKRVQCDEIWSYVGMKRKTVPYEKKGIFGIGNVWTWTAIDADSKLAISWLVGDRELDCATDFIADLESRLAGRIQLTTDGHGPYVPAVEKVFGANVDFSRVIKIFRADQSGVDGRYSPPQIIRVEKFREQGNPDEKHVSTAYVERQNLTMRMSMRRFTRLTNGFSKKVQNHEAAIALHFLHYNFARVHQTLRVTPAMAAGLSNHIWEIEEIVRLLDAKSKNVNSN